MSYTGSFLTKRSSYLRSPEAISVSAAIIADLYPPLPPKIKPSTPDVVAPAAEPVSKETTLPEPTAPPASPAALPPLIIPDENQIEPTIEPTVGPTVNTAPDDAKNNTDTEKSSCWSCIIQCFCSLVKFFANPKTKRGIIEVEQVIETIAPVTIPAITAANIVINEIEEISTVIVSECPDQKTK